MSTTEHERVEELLAVRALGGLEPRELDEYERIRVEHGLDCEVCRRAELEFDEIAGRLAFALGPVAVPEGMEDALLARALEERPAAGSLEPSDEPAVTPESGPRPPTDDLERARERRKGRRSGIGRRIAAVAAVVALVAGSFALGVAVSSGGGGETGQQQALAQYLLQPETQVVRFDATKGGNLAVAFQPGEDQAYVFGADLQPVPEGKQYELWLFPPDGGAPAPGPTFDPPDDDSVVVVSVPADPSESSLMAVTVEAEGGVGQPTQDPVFTAPITT